jgi:hypothetical protein
MLPRWLLCWLLLGSAAWGQPSPTSMPGGLQPALPGPASTGSSLSFNVDFTAGVLPSTFAFSRASPAIYINSSGALTSAAINVPRFEYVSGVAQGLLVEGVATNLYLNSQAPATQGITVTAQAYTISAYGVGTLVLSGAGSGTLTGTGASTLVQMTVTPTAGTLTLTPTGTLTYVQVETGSAPTSRIVTTGSSVTRSADLVTLTTQAFAQYVNTAQGAVFVDSSWLNVGFYSMLVELDNNNDGNNSIFIVEGVNSQTVYGQATSSGSGLTAGSFNFSLNTPFRVGFTFGGGSTSFGSNGGAVVTVATQPSALNVLALGPAGPSGGQPQASVYFRRLAIYKSALPSAQFQQYSTYGSALH